MKLGKFFMISGMPASGKGYFADNLSKEEDAVILSSDAIRKEIFGSEECQEDPKRVFQLMKKRANLLLKEGKNVIYDATNLSSRRRVHTIKNEVKADTYEIYYMATPYEQCLTRNMSRKRQVPISVMEKMYKSIEIPFKSEGWDKVEYIHDYNVISDNTEAVDIVRERNSADDRIGYLVKILHDTKCHDNLFGLLQRFHNLTTDFVKMYNLSHDSSYHSFSVSRHTFHVIEGVKNIENPIDREILLLGALYHDVGKPFCKSFYNYKGEERRYANYVNHENVGAHIALCDLYKLGADEELISEVVELVQNHMCMMDATPKTIKKLQNKMSVRQFDRLKTLHLSDSMAK